MSHHMDLPVLQGGAVLLHAVHAGAGLGVRAAGDGADRLLRHLPQDAPIQVLAHARRMRPLLPHQHPLLLTLGTGEQSK